MVTIKYFTPVGDFYNDKIINDGYFDESKNIPVIRFKSYDGLSNIDAFYTTRLGGVSSGYLESLNLGFSRGDLEDNVKENYNRAASVLGMRGSDIVMTKQTHTTNIAVADKDKALGDECTQKYEDIDGLVCDAPNIPVSATFADCVPIYLANDKKRIISLVHSGWKGTVGKIGKKAALMMSDMGSDISDIKCVIGPSISAINFEVGPEVKEAFENAFSKEQMKFISVLPHGEKVNIDLWAACYYALIEAGIREENIAFSGICTYDNSELLFSHRKTNGKRGNQNGFMMII